jgi:hypothetical protein
MLALVVPPNMCGLGFTPGIIVTPGTGKTFSPFKELK